MVAAPQVAKESTRQYMCLSQVAALCPPTKYGRPVHPSTVNKWITKGVKLRDKSRWRLLATKYPGGWMVRPEDLDSFLSRYTSDALGEDPSETAPAAPSASRRRELVLVDRELDAAGL